MLVCPCYDSQACSIQPPTLCTCHLQLRPPSRLTSEEAGYTPTCPAGCDQLDEQSIPKHAASARVAAPDPRRTVGSHEGQAGSTRCPICALPHLTADVSLSSSHRASSPSSPSPLQLLSHMHSGQGSAAFVVALTDGNRNSSANRPIVWLTGDR